ncbi:MAG: NTP transferase domain-containing protein [Kineosporiaceae bacterium]
MTRSSGPAPVGPAGREGVAGLVLAAGAGRRLGAPKATVRLGGRRLVDRQVGVLLAAGCDPVVAVLGAVVVDVPRAVVVVNPEWATGMGTSLAAGLRRLAGEAPAAPAVAVVLVDQPRVSADAVRRTAGALLASGGPAAQATYGGRPGHPVVLARPVWDEVARSARGDTGARGWLAEHATRVLLVPCDGLGDDGDLDTVADLDRASRDEPS